MSSLIFLKIFIVFSKVSADNRLKSKKRQSPSPQSFRSTDPWKMTFITIRPNRGECLKCSDCELKVRA